MDDATDPGTADPVEAYRLLIADIYQLAGLSRSTSEDIAEQAGGPTMAQWHAMSVVSDAPHTVPAIAERLGLARQSVQRVVNDLVDSGQLRLRPNPAHRRSPLVELTRRGRDSLRRANASTYETRLHQLTRAGLTPPELLGARTTVRKLLDALSDQD